MRSINGILIVGMDKVIGCNGIYTFTVIFVLVAGLWLCWSVDLGVSRTNRFSTYSKSDPYIQSVLLLNRTVRGRRPSNTGF